MRGRYNILLSDPIEYIIYLFTPEVRLKERNSNNSIDGLVFILHTAGRLIATDFLISTSTNPHPHPSPSLALVLSTTDISTIYR